MAKITLSNPKKYSNHLLCPFTGEECFGHLCACSVEVRSLEEFAYFCGFVANKDNVRDAIPHGSINLDWAEDIQRDVTFESMQNGEDE